MSEITPPSPPLEAWLAAADVAGWCYDGRARLLTWNQAMCRLHGCSRPPLDLAAWARLAENDALAEAVANMDAWDCAPRQWSYVIREPHPGTVTLTGLPLIESGKMHGLATFQPDLSHKLSAGLAAAVLDHIDVGVTLAPADQPFKLKYVNDAFLALVGYRRDEVLQRDVRFLQAEEEDPDHLDEVMRAHHRGRPTRVILKNHRKDQSPFYNQIHVQPLHDYQGRVTHFLSTQRDVSDQKQFEQESARHLSLFEIIFQRAAVGIALLDHDLHPVLVNAALADFLGRPREAVDTAAVIRLSVDDEDQDEDDFMLALQQNSLGRFRHERRFVRPDGRVVWGRKTATVVTLSDHDVPQSFVLVIIEDITESKELLAQKRDAESELKTMSTRLKMAIQPAQIGIWEYNIPSGELIWDERMLQLYGISADAFTGVYDAWRQGVHPDDVVPTERVLEKVLAGEGVFDTEFRVCLPDGRIRHVKADAMVLYDDDSQPFRMIGTNFDITDRIKNENKLKYRNALLRALQDVSPAGMLIIHRPEYSRQCDWNRRFLEMWRLDETDLLQVSADGILEMLEAKVVRDEATADEDLFITDGTVWALDLKLEHDLALEVYGQPVLDHDTQTMGYVWYFFDVSVRQAAEQRLRDAFAESSRLVRLMQGREQRILELKHEVNACALRGGFDAPYLIEAPTKAPDGISDEWNRLDPAGVPLWLERVAELGDDYRNALSIAEDLEIQKQRAANLAMYAEKASRAKSVFLANMSHEIRTPLNAVIGIAELLSDSGLNKYQLDMLAKLDGSARTLMNIINDILDFSKIEANQVEVEEARFDLAQLLEDLAGMTATRAQDKNIDVLFDMPHDLHRYVVGDVVRLNQVLINLLGNAVKFTDTGTVTLRVRQETRAQGRHFFHFEVEDTGLGMDEDQIERLFRPFTQADASTTRRFGGTGLGLSISKSLVDLLGGTISVRSRLGQGSLFRVALPMDVAGVETLCDPLPAWPETTRVLLVEAERASGRLVQKMLEAFGVRCVWVRSGTQALTSLRESLAGKTQFGLILAAWGLPDVEDLEVNHAVAKMPWPNRPPPIVVMTAHSRKRLLQLARGTAIEDVLIKPVTPMALLRVMRDVFGFDASSPQPRPAPNEALRGMRVLLVEDVEVNREVASALLSRAGALVSVAVNGKNAVETLCHGPTRFDVVLMDVHMPVLDGFAATEQIRKQLGEDAPPIVALTAKAFREDRQQAEEAGMVDYLTKPMQIGEVIEVLQRVVAKHGAVRMPDVPPHEAEPDAAEVPLDRTTFTQTIADLGGNRAFFDRQMTSFTSTYSDLAQRVQALIGDDHWDEAAALAHAAKGAAANLGAAGLAGALERLEHDLRRNNCSGNALTDTIQAFADLAVTVARWREQGSAENEATVGPLDGAVEAEAFAQLLMQLRQSDLAAQTLWDQLRPQLLLRFGAAACAQVQTALDRLEFSKAADLLASFEAESS